MAENYLREGARCIAGRPPSYDERAELLWAAGVALGDHVDFVYRLGVVADSVGSPVFRAVRFFMPAPFA